MFGLGNRLEPAFLFHDWCCVLQVNVDVRYVSPEAGRAVFTQRAMKKGELLVALPLDLAFSAAKHGGNGPNEVRTLHYNSSTHTLSHRWRC
jgi:hypothetical protein